MRSARSPSTLDDLAVVLPLSLAYGTWYKPLFRMYSTTASGTSFLSRAPLLDGRSDLRGRNVLVSFRQQVQRDARKPQRPRWLRLAELTQSSAAGRNPSGSDDATSASEYPGRAATINSHSFRSASASCHFAMSRKASMPIRKYNRSLLRNPAFTRRTVSIGIAGTPLHMRLWIGRFEQRGQKIRFCPPAPSHHRVAMKERRNLASSACAEEYQRERTRFPSA